MRISVPLDPAELAEHFREAGFVILPGVFPPKTMEHLQKAIEAIPAGDEVRKKGSIYGVRNLLEISPAVRELAASTEIHQILSPILGEAAFATWAVFFDKLTDANWTLGWHQDSVISVAEKKSVPGFTAWGQKAGVWQVQPPVEILSRMVAVRVHLDDCGPENGPLRVIPGSHRHGWQEERLDRWKQTVSEVVCTVDQGGIVLMCPLTLHASSKAQSPTHRRVIHIEYANQDLPAGLKWNTRIGKLKTENPFRPLTPCS
jgi:ectoine hydroxylase-related dioxygenase (phytanoyl-CoA dioxygenase family)